MSDTSRKAVITVQGKDTVGIIARTSTYLAEVHVNILDISQNIIRDFFNMVMIVDISNMHVTFQELQAHLSSLGEDIGVEIRCQREEIFEMMHRI